MKTLTCIAASFTCFFAYPGDTAVGPSPYLGYFDSPFNEQTLTCLFFEDFEDGTLDAPGVSGDGILYSSSGFPDSQNDSVDEDDGVIDGNTVGADSYISGNVGSGPRTISLDFDLNVLGAYPTHVGIVWTDGLGNTTFRVFDGSGEEHGSIGPIDISDPFVTGETAEDSFFGWISAEGISKIEISDDLTGLEVDHLQYGFAASSDVDADGILDMADNCLNHANADQRDTDGDGLGNACDADLNNDCVVNVVDLGLLRSVFFTTDPDADFNGDGIVNVQDLGLMRLGFFAAPGPTCANSLCTARPMVPKRSLQAFNANRM